MLCVVLGFSKTLVVKVVLIIVHVSPVAFSPQTLCSRRPAIGGSYERVAAVVSLLGLPFMRLPCTNVTNK